jgi:hypothetical protein
LLVLVLATGFVRQRFQTFRELDKIVEGYNERSRYSNSTDNGCIILTVVEQQNRIFNGNITIKQENETEKGKGFTEAIGVDNKTLYIADLIRAIPWGR